jgi:two-component system response regulator AtoC
METPQLLIVDDEKPTRDGLRAALEDRYDVYVAEDVPTALGLLERERFEVVLTDLRMPGADGMDLIRRAKSLNRPPVCILMTAYGSEDVAVRAMKEGADDYIAKGRLQLDELEMRIARALKGRDLEVENVELKKELSVRFGLENLIGESDAMREVVETIRQVAPTQATILLLGETGTGKEMAAKAIHQLSSRARRPMVTVHCAALAPTLLESELFGHEKGAFTGANERRIGRFEQAGGGTLFLDEIGEIDASVQIKLLRLLGERTFERLGSSKTISADVRLISATNKNLAEKVKEGVFREDLYYRLNVVPVAVPPLNARREDIQALAERFLAQACEMTGQALRSIGGDAMSALQSYDWPGNVRELRNAVERMLILAPADPSHPITAEYLPREVVGLVEDIAGPDRHGEIMTLPLREARERFEHDYLSAQIKRFDGNISRTAEFVGMERSALHRKLKSLGVLGTDKSN